MNSQNIRIDGFSLVGNYAFDGAKNVEIHHATLMTKDALWNCENVTVYDTFTFQMRKKRYGTAKILR
ncbi:hypothetical protein WP50_11865 [Lactiplantibacillus plantarum]|nr:hypothetical protein WP50_11865 [Lactiplantibacillus plantarum]